MLLTLIILARAKISKAKKIIIATGDDYINLQILNKVKTFTNLEVYLRLEKLNSDNIKSMCGTKSLPILQDKLTCFNLSETIVEDIILYNRLRYRDIIILGLGSVGQKLMHKLHKENNILIIEQSQNTINIVKEYPEISNSQNVKFSCQDISSLTQRDMMPLMQKIEYQRIYDDNQVVFICVGGDWQGFITAIKWKTWVDNYDIYLTGNSIDKNHFLITNMTDTSCGKLDTKNIIEDGLNKLKIEEW